MGLTPFGNPRLREVALVAALFAAVTALVMWPLLGVLKDHFPVAASDAKLNAWALAWGADRLPHGLVGFWSPPIFYPYSNTLAYSENLLGIAAVVAPVQWVFGTPTLTYDVAFLLSFVVAGTTSFLLARDLTGSRSAALIAAFGFAFTPYRWAQLTHLQVLWTAWLPLALWAMHGAFRTHRWLYWGLCVGAVLLQVFSSGYSAFHAALALGVIGLAGAVRYGVSLIVLRRMAVAVLALGLLLSSSLVAYYQVWRAREPTPGDFVAYSADLGTYLDVHADLPDSRWLPGVAQDEGHLFPGTAVAVLALLALAPIGRRRPVTRWRWVYGTLALLAVIASLGPEPRAWGHPLPIPGVYAWFTSTVPLFNAMRVPARFGMVAILACTMLAAIGAARVLAGVRRGRRVALAACLSLLIVWEGYGGPLTVVPSLLVSANGDDAAYEWLAAQPPGPVLILPMASLGGRFTLHQQFGVLRHGHPMVDGAGRVDTPLVEWLTGSGSPLVVPELLPQAVPFLRGLGVRYVLMRRNVFRDPGIGSRLFDTLDHDVALIERGRFGDGVAWEVDPGPARPDEKPGLSPLRPEGFSLSASENADRILMAVDGDPNSRWLSRGPQDGSEWVAIELDRPRRLGRIDFTMHERSVINYPRVLQIVSTGTVGGGAETVLYDGPILEQLGWGWKSSPNRPVASIALPDHMTTRLLIRQLGQGIHWWAIDELALWERR